MVDEKPSLPTSDCPGLVRSEGMLRKHRDRMVSSTSTRIREGQETTWNKPRDEYDVCTYSTIHGIKLVSVPILPDSYLSDEHRGVFFFPGKRTANP